MAPFYSSPGRLRAGRAVPSGVLRWSYQTAKLRSPPFDGPERSDYRGDWDGMHAYLDT